MKSNTWNFYGNTDFFSARYRFLMSVFTLILKGKEGHPGGQPSSLLQIYNIFCRKARNVKMGNGVETGL